MKSLEEERKRGREEGAGRVKRGRTHRAPGLSPSNLFSLSLSSLSLSSSRAFAVKRWVPLRYTHPTSSCLQPLASSCLFLFSSPPLASLPLASEVNHE